jgi:hypothetical protein
MVQNRKAKKRGPDYANNKKAFDVVLRRIRNMGNPQIGAMGAINPERSGGSGSAKNPAKPSMVDFRCDVWMAIKSSIPKDIDLVEFHLAYTLYDSEDYIDREKHAQKVLHDRRHSVEQRLGAEFIKRGLHRANYFTAPRVTRGR